MWVKVTEQGQVLSGNGKRLRNAGEEFWVCVKGDVPVKEDGYHPPNIIAARRREASRKPDEQYCIAANLWPDAYTLGIFEKYHNHMNGKADVGNEPW